MTNDWKSVAEAKKASVNSLVPTRWILDPVPTVSEAPNAAVFIDSIVPAFERKITSSSAVELLNLLSSGDLSAVQVCDAFCHRTALAHQLLNCCSEIFFDQAYERAKELDAYFETTGKLVGPLHGIPVSLKDQLQVKGLDTAMGIVGLLNDPAENESLLTTILRASGAVLYVKTTVPMAMMAAETYSNIMGTTVNALNRNLTAGGSSGGEAALIAAGGSIIGFGTDLAGSIRIPAAFHGIYGLRPSRGRVPYYGIRNSNSGQPITPSVVGPMTKHLEDLELVMKVVLDSKPWLEDIRTVPLPWSYPDSATTEVSKSCRIAVMKWNGVIRPHPPILRAIEICTTKLRAAGFDVVVVDPPAVLDKLALLASSILASDGMQGLKGLCSLSGEPMIPQIMKLKAKFLNHQQTPPPTVTDHWKQNEQKYELEQEFMKFWNDLGLDALICPVWESTAFVPLNGANSRTMYTIVQNILDLPSIVVPVTTVDKAVDKAVDDSYEPMNDLDLSTQKLYDPEILDGIPVCVQLVTRRLQEEQAVFLAEQLAKALA